MKPIIENQVTGPKLEPNRLLSNDGGKTYKRV